MSPNLKQVACTYSYAFSLVGLAAFVIFNFSVLKQHFGLGTVIAGIVLAVLVFLILPGTMRRQAIRRAGLRVVRRRRHC
jgi:hypothetical protein